MARAALLALLLAADLRGVTGYGDVVPSGIEIVLDADGIEHTGQKGQEFVVGEGGKVAENWKATKVTKADDTPKVMLKNVEVSRALPLAQLRSSLRLLTSPKSQPSRACTSCVPLAGHLSAPPSYTRRIHRRATSSFARARTPAVSGGRRSASATSR